jgi:hypothetical protein
MTSSSWIRRWRRSLPLPSACVGSQRRDPPLPKMLEQVADECAACAADATERPR